MQRIGDYYFFQAVFDLPALEGYYAFNKNTPDETVQ